VITQQVRLIIRLRLIVLLIRLVRNRKHVLAARESLQLRLFFGTLFLHLSALLSTFHPALFIESSTRFGVIGSEHVAERLHQLTPNILLGHALQFTSGRRPCVLVARWWTMGDEQAEIALRIGDDAIHVVESPTRMFDTAEYVHIRRPEA
jgi:hypothetical protein